MNNGVARGGIRIEGKGRWKGRVVTLAKLLHPPLSCQTFYYFFQEEPADILRRGSEADGNLGALDFLCLPQFIKEGFDSPQRQGNISSPP
jgi:hypothetical protein